jgi:hypothetical protein
MMGVSGIQSQKGKIMRRRFIALAAAIGLTLGGTFGLIAALGVHSLTSNGTVYDYAYSGGATTASPAIALGE